jgi:hypothetical protein
MVYHEDGLADIVIGVSILFCMVTFALDLIWLATSWTMVFFFVWLAAKELITVPRVARMEFSSEQVGQLQRRLFRLVLVFSFTALLGAVMFALFYLIADRPENEALSWFRDNTLVVLALTAGLILALIAGLVDITRYYVYALLTVVIVVGGDLLQLSGILYGTLWGSVFLLGGLTCLVNFLRATVDPI